MGESEIWVSAVVELRSLPEPESAPEEPGDVAAPPADVPAGFVPEPAANPHAGGGHQHKAVQMPPGEARMARIKQFFASSGFEVHAPVGRTFSIGGKQALFESFFGTDLTVQDDPVSGRIVTPEVMGLDPLPEDVRNLVRWISFPPPPRFFSG